VEGIGRNRSHRAGDDRQGCSCDAKIYHPDEIREKRGDVPMSAEMRAQMDMATFSSTPNATQLPPDQQAAQDERDSLKAEAEAKRLETMKPVPQTPAQKAAEFATMAKAFATPAPTINVAAPTITLPAMPAINFPAVKVDAPTINLPPPPAITLGDVFVDVGATNMQAKFDAPPKAPKTVTAKRNADGSFTGNH